jgi:hypothetical protein
MKIDFQLGALPATPDRRCHVGRRRRFGHGALAAKSGAEVIGVTLQLYDHEAVRRSGACCAGGHL